MPRRRITTEELLSAIERSAGGRSRRTARELLVLAGDIGAELWGRQRAVSIRLPGPITSDQHWLTLFVISVAGTLYTNWVDRWSRAGVDPKVAKQYEASLAQLLGGPTTRHPSAFKAALPLEAVAAKLDGVESVIRSAAGAIWAAVDEQTKAKHLEGAETAAAELSDIEGMAAEVRATRRGRSRRLRKKARELSKGVCEACGRDYSRLLGGRGWRVLHVHHRDQLGVNDSPRVTKVSDLAVVCANCHMLIHYDPKNAMTVEDLCSMLAAERVRHR